MTGPIFVKFADKLRKNYGQWYSWSTGCEM